MVGLFRNKYLWGFILVYFVAKVILTSIFHQPFSDSLFFAFLFGIFLPFISYALTRNFPVPPADKPAFKNEALVIIALVLWICWYISYGTGWINSLVPKSLFDLPRETSIYVLVKKLSVFFLIPFLLYRTFGFGLNDFGLNIRGPLFQKSHSAIVFIILSLIVLVYQYIWGQGAEPLRKGIFSTGQIIIGIPLCFAWYFIEVGLVEEFFFRALLQSRISVLLKSNVAGILISGLIFGLAHAPGLYLRGAGSEGVNEQLPFIFWAAYTITVMSLAGIFLGIIWSRTRNLWLIMAIHAMVDLIPNLPDFIRTWHL